MALKPILNLVDISADADVVTVVDATGDYSTSNPGGFGTPNPAKTDVTGVILSLYKFSDPTNSVAARLSSITDIFGTGAALTPSLFPGITTGTVFNDGVYGIKYDVAVQQSGSLGWVGGSKQFTVTNADTIFAGAIGFTLGGNSTTIYHIDTSQPLNSVGGWVLESLPQNFVEGYETIYEGDTKILIDKAGDRCLTEDIGIWADNGCRDDNFRNIWPRYKQRIAMRAKFIQGYLSDADGLAQHLANYCECNNPQPCNC